MAEEKYEVYGNYKGNEIKEEVFAYSMEQAKFKTGLDLGFTGKEYKEFKKKVKARRK